MKQHGSWVLSKKASPGNFSHFEDDIFGADGDNLPKSVDGDMTSCFVSIRTSSNDSGGLVVGLAFVDVIMRDISLIEFVDTPHLYQLETVLFRKGPKVTFDCLFDSLNFHYSMFSGRKRLLRKAQLTKRWPACWNEPKFW